MFMAGIYHHENMSGLWHCFTSGKMVVWPFDHQTCRFDMVWLSDMHGVSQVIHGNRFVWKRSIWWGTWWSNWNLGWRNRENHLWWRGHLWWETRHSRQSRTDRDDLTFLLKCMCVLLGIPSGRLRLLMGNGRNFQAPEGTEWWLVYVWNHLNNSWERFRIHRNKDN